MVASSPHQAWPDLPYSAWRETRDTLHLWTQVVGKIRLALAPWLNHSWHVALYVTTRGLTTSPIHDGQRAFEIVFDFNEHVLDITTSDGGCRRIVLGPQTVAAFYDAVTGALGELGIHVRINDRPCEIPGAMPFSRFLFNRRTIRPSCRYSRWMRLMLTFQPCRVVRITHSRR